MTSPQPPQLPKASLTTPGPQHVDSQGAQALPSHSQLRQGRVGRKDTHPGGGGSAGGRLEPTQSHLCPLHTHHGGFRVAPEDFQPFLAEEGVLSVRCCHPSDHQFLHLPPPGMAGH